MQTFISMFALVAIATASPMACPVPPPPPPTSETVTVSSFNVIRPELSATPIETVNFVINGDDAADLSCRQLAPTLPSSAPVVCEGSGYSFTLEEGSTEGGYAITVSHDTWDGHLLEGPKTDIPTICRAAGNRRTICSSISETTILLTA